MFYVYKITNQINGKIYIGVHRTSNVDDGYMGSGKLIKAAIKKYGLDSFSKDILAQFESADEMFNEEKNLISSLSPEYNLHPGGNGGWDLCKYHDKTQAEKNIFHLAGRFATDALMLEKYGTDWRKVISSMGQDAIKTKKLEDPTFMTGDNGWSGRSHSEKTKQKMKASAVGKHIGSKNSQFGKHWITDGVSSKSIFRDQPIPDGWIKGRVINK